MEMAGVYGHLHAGIGLCSLVRHLSGGPTAGFPVETSAKSELFTSNIPTGLTNRIRKSRPQVGSLKENQMFLRKKFTVSALILSLGACGATGLAQQIQSTT